MGGDKKTIAKLLDMPEDKVKIDRYAYDKKFPDEIKAWKHIGRKDPDLRAYKGRLYYPATALMLLIDLAAELLVTNRFIGLGALPGLVATDTRFRKPVMPENELLIQVKLLRNYKGKIGIFSGVIADREGDVVAENIFKGALIKV
jgi:3-hydroxymyristoyl/3-hydroxydecanoyl-(acyl carrier protein) dehydratase